MASLLRPFHTFSSLPLTFSKQPSVNPLLFATHRSSKRFPSPSSSIMATAARKVLVPIANGTEPLEAVVIIDVLRRAGTDVTVASVEKQLQVDACHGIKIVADALVSDCADTVFDLISLPGGLPGSTTLKDCEILEKIVKKQALDGRLYSAICAAPAVALGSWGLLNGKKCTCYPSFMEQLSSSGTVVEDIVQQDGNVVTSRGPGTVMEFSVALIEQLLGKDKADEVSGPLVMSPKHGDEYSILELNPLKWTCDKNPKILVPIADGTEEMEATIIIDVLRRAKAEVVVASVGDTLEILASRKVKLVADTLLQDAAKLSYDLIVLPGGLGGAQAFSKSDILVEMLKNQLEANKPYGAICASPALVLEPHGLLKGKKATAFPAMCSKLSDQSEVENRVVVDGNLITSRGPGTSIEFALAIVEKFWSREKALELAKTMVFVQP
ncbi:protein DJ-1 homolog B-like [Impatiens glandulifera]|uniref:protein DJ-1 homolog B-like n=1 Tax=Impatiens glandulifera TaxID=253017 RepID=UPI001FB19436|nr:protein DJ-1 homolog B-like [Impatiens glandulifera]